MKGCSLNVQHSGYRAIAICVYTRTFYHKLIKNTAAGTIYQEQLQIYSREIRNAEMEQEVYANLFYGYCIQQEMLKRKEIALII